MIITILLLRLLITIYSNDREVPRLPDRCGSATTLRPTHSRHNISSVMHPCQVSRVDRDKAWVRRVFV